MHYTIHESIVHSAKRDVYYMYVPDTHTVPEPAVKTSTNLKAGNSGVGVSCLVDIILIHTQPGGGGGEECKLAMARLF